MIIKLCICKKCHNLFVLKGKYVRCEVCRKIISKRVMLSRQRKYPGIKIGIGSGGNQEGDKNPCYKGGYSVYKQTYHKHKPKRYCEKCGSTKFLVIHHKDGNRKNVDINNLIELCRHCHAIEHKLHENFN